MKKSKNKGILELFRNKSTVFSTDDVALILEETDKNKLYKKLKYYVKKGDLFRIRKGFYARNNKYDKKEFANKLYAPSYISLETVLLRKGVTFQWYDTIFSVGGLSRELEVDGQKYKYSKLKNDALTNTLGIKKEDNYYIATRERAFLDRIYLNSKYYFDNLDELDWEKCFEIVKIYNKKTMLKRLESYYTDYKDKK